MSFGMASAQPFGGASGASNNASVQTGPELQEISTEVIYPRHPDNI